MVYLLKWNSYSLEEQALCVFTQGILNRKNIRVFIDIDNYLSYLHEEYEEINIYDLIIKYKDKFSNIITYNLDSSDISINLAAMLCVKYDFLAVPNKIIDKILSIIDLKVIYNLDNFKGNNAYRQKIVFEHVKDNLNNNALVHQVVKKDNFHLMLRDYSIKNRLACIYTSENSEDLAFREEILKWLKPVSPIYGWNDDEISFIKHISKYGHYALPSDWSSNHSYFIESNKNNIKQKPKRTEIRKNKHYLAIVISDGDNIQWLERDFQTTSTFGNRLLSPLNYKITWTISPSLINISKEVIENIYKTPKNDYFIASVSGIGYANILSFPNKYIKEFIDKSIKAMEKSDQCVVCLLDSKETFISNEFVNSRLQYYSKNDKILGGIWEIDPDRYSSGKGKIIFSNSKPFVSVRYSLWCPYATTGNTPKSFLDEYINKINSMKPNIHSQDGYTVLNVHPWSISISDLDYVISHLNDDIELVYADELIELIKENMVEKYDKNN